MTIDEWPALRPTSLCLIYQQMHCIAGTCGSLLVEERLLRDQPTGWRNCTPTDLAISTMQS
jgi:hypothetical protein